MHTTFTRLHLLFFSIIFIQAKEKYEIECSKVENLRKIQHSDKNKLKLEKTLNGVKIIG